MFEAGGFTEPFGKTFVPFCRKEVPDVERDKGDYALNYCEEDE